MRVESLDKLIRGLRDYTVVRENLLAARESRDGGQKVLEKAAYRCLLALEDAPARSGELAERLLSDPSTISRHIGQLVASGYVERQADPVDGRATVLVLTGSGREFAKHIRAARIGLMDRMLTSWSDEDLADLAQLFGRFVDDVRRATSKHAGDARPGGCAGSDRPDVRSQP